MAGLLCNPASSPVNGESEGPAEAAAQPANGLEEALDKSIALREGDRTRKVTKRGR